MASIFININYSRDPSGNVHRLSTTSRQNPSITIETTLGVHREKNHNCLYSLVVAIPSPNQAMKVQYSILITVDTMP